MLPSGVDGGEVLLLQVGDGAIDALEDDAGEADDGIERGAQLVGHVGKELGFKLVELTQLLGGFLLGFVEGGVFERGGSRVGEGHGQVELVGGEQALAIVGLEGDEAEGEAFGSQGESNLGFDTPVKEIAALGGFEEGVRGFENQGLEGLHDLEGGGDKGDAFYRERLIGVKLLEANRLGGVFVKDKLFEQGELGGIEVEQGDGDLGVFHDADEVLGNDVSDLVRGEGDTGQRLGELEEEAELLDSAAGFIKQDDILIVEVGILDGGGDLADEGFGEGKLLRGEEAGWVGGVEADGANNHATGDDGEEGDGLDAALVEGNLEGSEQWAGLGGGDADGAAGTQDLLDAWLPWMGMV